MSATALPAHGAIEPGGGARGWIACGKPRAAQACAAPYGSAALAPALPPVLGARAALFDLDATRMIAVSSSALGAARCGASPGLRVPGAFDGFESRCARCSASRSA